MGRHSRTKGRAFEQAIARQLRTVWPDARREWQFRGPERPDIGGCPFHVECKADEGMSVDAMIRQAVTEAQGQPPLVIFKRNRRGIYAVLRLADFLLLAGKPR